MTHREFDALAEEFARICARAALPVMEVYASDFEALSKEDRSPVTLADTRAEAVICEALQRLLPGVPVIAEERFSSGDRPLPAAEFLLVDPVDGTREFINRNGEFTLNIALVSGHVPVAGAVYAPVHGRMFMGGATARGAHILPGMDSVSGLVEPIRVRPRPQSGGVATISRSHADADTMAVLAREGITETLSAGSSLKFCLIAEGRADLYPRFGPTMEWDTAAGHAVLAAAGGSVTCVDGSPFVYGKYAKGYRNTAFIARGG